MELFRKTKEDPLVMIGPPYYRAILMIKKQLKDLLFIHFSFETQS